MFSSYTVSNISVETCLSKKKQNCDKSALILSHHKLLHKAQGSYYWIF